MMKLAMLDLAEGFGRYARAKEERREELVGGAKRI
jgi:hypothetical protein